MKFFYFFVVLVIACILGFANACSGPICAKDLKSGNPQNFPSDCAMQAENGRGGRKFDLNNKMERS